MTEELRASISNIRKLSPKLNKVTDEANQLVARVEELLRDECSIGIPASVCLDDSGEDVDDHSMRWSSLSYNRVDGKFCIAVEVELCRGAEDEDSCDRRFTESITPWSQCPRHKKLQAFPALPKLLHEIAKKAGCLLSQTEETAKAVDKLLDAMK